jgi:hypothetical protein
MRRRPPMRISITSVVEVGAAFLDTMMEALAVGTFR